MIEKRFGGFADIPARSKIALQTLMNTEINLSPYIQKISDDPFISKGRLKSETGNAAGLKLFFCVQKTKFSSSLRFAFCLIGCLGCAGFSSFVEVNRCQRRYFDGERVGFAVRPDFFGLQGLSGGYAAAVVAGVV